MNTQKTNWWLDALLFAGFIILFLLDVTGIEFHQWLGISMGVLILAHLVRHLDCITTVLSRFFGKTSPSARVNLVIDAGLGIGFVLIIFTGLIISTWLNLTFIDYASWKYIHILTSVFTLFALLLKIFLHRKWIVCVAEKHIFGRNSKKEPGSVVLPQWVGMKVNRREFLKVSALLGAGTIIGVTQIHKVLEEAVTEKISNSSAAASASTVTPASVAGSSEVVTQEQSVAATVEQPTALPTAVVAKSSQSTTACSVLCRRGCSFPGQCRKYVDSNGNGKCDRGECL